MLEFIFDGLKSLHSFQNISSESAHWFMALVFMLAGQNKTNSSQIFGLTGYTEVPLCWVCSDTDHFCLHRTDPLTPQRHTGNLMSRTKKRWLGLCSEALLKPLLKITHPGSRSSCDPAGCRSRLYKSSRFHCRRWVYSGTDLIPDGNRIKVSSIKELRTKISSTNDQLLL